MLDKALLGREKINLSKPSNTKVFMLSSCLFVSLVLCNEVWCCWLNMLCLRCCAPLACKHQGPESTTDFVGLFAGGERLRHESRHCGRPILPTWLCNHADAAHLWDKSNSDRCVRSSKTLIIIATSVLMQQQLLVHWYAIQCWILDVQMWHLASLNICCLCSFMTQLVRGAMSPDGVSDCSEESNMGWCQCMLFVCIYFLFWISFGIWVIQLLAALM